METVQSGVFDVVAPALEALRLAFSPADAVLAVAALLVLAAVVRVTRQRTPVATPVDRSS